MSSRTFRKILVLARQALSFFILLLARGVARVYFFCRDTYRYRVGFWPRLKGQAGSLFQYCNQHRVLSLALCTMLLALVVSTVMQCESSETITTVREIISSSNKKSINSKLNNAMSDLEQTKGFDREIETFMRRWGLTGASFALMRGDSLIYAKGYGYADRDRKIECDVKHTFRIASASKLITATAIMKLIEQEKLSLKTPVFGKNGILRDTSLIVLQDSRMERITVEHLLRHTAGFSTPVSDPAFANYSVARALERNLPLQTDDMVRYATMYRLRSNPGERYDYSNLGYIILGKIVEVVSGESYEKYVQNEILAPIGCHDIYIADNYSKDRGESEVKYYEVKEAELYDAFDGSGKRTLKSNGGNNVTLLGGAGGWVASPVELLRLVASINGSGAKKDILTPELVKTMACDNKVNRPIGWATVHGSEWLRSGSMAGTSSLIKQQRDGYTWVFVTNSSAWIGYHLSSHISSNISRSISKVKSWPHRDLFEGADQSQSK